MPNICHSLCSLSALQFVMVPICNKLHLDQLLWNDAQKFLTCKCKTKSWSKPILLPWGLSIVYCPFNTKANTADLQDCVPHTSVLSTKPVGIMEVPSIVQEHRRSQKVNLRLTSCRHVHQPHRELRVFILSVSAAIRYQNWQWSSNLQVSSKA